MRSFWRALFLLALGVGTTQAADPQPLKLVQTIPLPGVIGRLDHLASDPEGARLFLTALANNTVEVIDLRTGSRLQSVSGFNEPQGVVFLPDLHQLAVANGGDGTCVLLDGISLARLRTITLGDDADNVRYDPATRRLYVGYGAALGIIDTATGVVVGRIQLRGHPESFQLEPSGSRIYVNIPSAHEVAVLDPNQQRILEEWPMSIAAGNFPMALDAAHHRLLIGFRQPATLGVLDTGSGTVVATLECVRDVDDLFYDTTRRYLYLAGGGGRVDVVIQASADTYQRLVSFPTAVGSRTALFVPERNQLFLAVPQHGTQSAEIRVYQIQS